MPESDYKVWMCIICGWIYDEAKGAPEEGLEPGMRWDDIPDYWVCPDCGAGKRLRNDRSVSFICRSGTLAPSGFPECFKGCVVKDESARRNQAIQK